VINRGSVKIQIRKTSQNATAHNKQVLTLHHFPRKRAALQLTHSPAVCVPPGLSEESKRLRYDTHHSPFTTTYCRG